MINFKSIKYKNFLSTGDTYTEIQLDKTITTIITGENGAGKSTFIDALVYALFGKPFRKVRLGQIINKVNEKGLKVQLDFSIGNKNYTVKRGMKPAIFEIWVNDEMLPQPAETKVYQGILEDDILKLNYKTFTQIIVLGSASFLPFMQQTISVRREIIENLLDISVFSDMNKILKSKIKEGKADIVQFEHNMELLKTNHKTKREFLNESNVKYNTQLDSHKDHINAIKQSLDNKWSKLSGITKEIEYLKDKLSSFGTIENDYIKYKESVKGFITKKKYLQQQIDNINKDNKSYAENIKSIGKVQLVIEALSNEITDISYEINAVCNEYSQEELSDTLPSKISEQQSCLKTKEMLIQQEKTKRDFYEAHDECPECKQSIEEDFKNTTLSTIETNISQLLDEVCDIKDNISKMDARLTTIKKASSKVQELESTLMVKTSQLASSKTELERLSNKEFKHTPVQKIQVILKELHKTEKEDAQSEDKLKEYNKIYDEFLEVRNLLSTKEKESLSEKQNIKSTEELLIQVNTDLTTLKQQEPCSITQEDIDELAQKIKETSKDLDKKKHIMYYYTIVQKLLKDDGLKTQIIKRFLPIINANVNMFLDKFDFPINFEFDENFNERIQSKFRDDFGYYSFSEGEKSRIDLALLFTWREIALKKSRNATNIVIFDEIMDGSLDGNGIENFMSVLGMNEGYSSFIISHKEETINSRFDRSLVFTKDGHFSKLKEIL
jgi:DNA repair exonuclease SbcCD ATPase subunit